MSDPERVDQLITPDGDQFGLTDGLTIGRAETETVQLPDSAVSRQHAIVHRSGDRWLLQDCGSRNGTRLNDARLPSFTDVPLRDGDRLTIGRMTMRVRLAQSADPDVTSRLSTVEGTAIALSPYQLQVIRLLAEPWVAGHEPATNAEIAERLGTPNAVEAVKAALRRCYVKAGIANLATHTKRRELCRLASERGWI